MKQMNYYARQIRYLEKVRYEGGPRIIRGIFPQVGLRIAAFFSNVD